MYVDVAVIPVPEDKVEAYKKMGRTAAKYWIKHGALQYYECMGDDTPKGKVADFYRAVKCKEGETVGVSVVITKNRKHRDEVMKKAMSDQTLAAQMKNMPFDGKRMIVGGFKPFVELEAKEYQGSSIADKGLSADFGARATSAEDGGLCGCP